MEYILETNNLEKKYKKFKAVDNVNIHIPKGAIYGLIGKNGAGKTTLIRLICGLQHVTNGEYFIYGVSNKDKQLINVRKKLGAIIEQPSIYYDMTAKDNLIEQYKVIGLSVNKDIEELLKLVGLSDVGKKKVKNFSLRNETKTRNSNSTSRRARVFNIR